MKRLEFNFDNSYYALPDILYTALNPVPVKDPKMVIVNDALMQELGIDAEYLSADICSGNKIAENSQPLAQAYAGHQFGHFTMLGDGRAHLLGEHISPDGTRTDIQLKGSGQTPYSRSGDGRAALKPMLREYIISEAMHGLGIPTTRSLAVVTTGEVAQREEDEQGAILMRIAASHIRVGTFQYAVLQQDTDLLKSLCDYTLQRHYPEMVNAYNKPVALIEAVMEKQADLIVHWMRVGFIHGVMNTDNMTLSGETIDYGPCAFMNVYDPKTVFSSIDHMGRYAYSKQPTIAAWNIARFAETLLLLIDADIDKAITIAEEIINRFLGLYKKKWIKNDGVKLGLDNTTEQDKELFSDLLMWMYEEKQDYTNFFVDFMKAIETDTLPFDCPKFKDWYERYQKRFSESSLSKAEAVTLMRKNNPVIIPSVIIMLNML